MAVPGDTNLAPPRCQNTTPHRRVLLVVVEAPARLVLVVLVAVVALESVRLVGVVGLVVGLLTLPTLLQLIYNYRFLTDFIPNQPLSLVQSAHDPGDLVLP